MVGMPQTSLPSIPTTGLPPLALGGGSGWNWWGEWARNCMAICSWGNCLLDPLWDCSCSVNLYLVWDWRLYVYGKPSALRMYRLDLVFHISLISQNALFEPLEKFFRKLDQEPGTGAYMSHCLFSKSSTEPRKSKVHQFIKPTDEGNKIHFGRNSTGSSMLRRAWQ